ncbi:MAG: phosphate signaling complex protein PhoU [Desulfobacteraceae bacterium]
MVEGYLSKELNKIKKEILSLGTLVEDRFKNAMYAVKINNLELAQSIIDTDHEVDDREIEIEEECLKVLALYQPVAGDLRLIVAIIKINNDLERIADLAKSISRRLKSAVKSSSAPFEYDYTYMAEKVGKMFKLSLDAIVGMDVDMAHQVIGMDEDVNTMRNDAYEYMKKSVDSKESDLDRVINMYLISRHLERIADHTTNIAEEVVHLVEGRIIRHRSPGTPYPKKK